MTGRSTPTALDQLARPLRRGERLLWVTASAASALVILGLGAWLVRVGLVRSPGWVLVAWPLAALAVAGAVVLAVRGLRDHTLPEIARRLERAGGWRSGTLTALLEAAGEGTSPSLLGAADRRVAAQVVSHGPEALGGEHRRLRRRGTAAGAGLAAGMVLLASAGPVHGPAAQLWHPGAAWEALAAPVRIAPDRALVDRGDSVRVAIEAVGRRVAQLWVRVPGESWAPRMVTLDSLGHGAVVLGPLLADSYLHASSGGRSSDTVMVRVRVPAFLGALELTAHYPGYLRLDPEPLPVVGDTLLLPAGTRLTTRGQATAPLGEAHWSGPAGPVVMEVTGTRFEGTMMPRTSGAYRLEVTTATGAPLTGDLVSLPVRVIPDAIPQVEVPVPGADTMAPLGLQIPIVLDARDDHGLTALGLVLRISRAGANQRTAGDSTTVVEIPLPAPGVDRAIVPYLLDLTDRALGPGDTVHYRARATDNTPEGQIGRSREFILVIPTGRQARDAQREATDDVARRLDSLVAQSRELEKRAEDLARTRARDASAQNGQQGTLNFEEAKKAESVLEGERDLLDEAREVERSLEELAQAAEKAGIGDSAFERQLSEIRDQLRQALTPELKEKLAALEQALRDLNPEQARQALKDLAEAQQRLREALERSRELFRRAALEGELASLSQEAKDVSGEQQDLNQSMATADTSAIRQAEESLAGRTDSLAAGLERAADRMDQAGAQERMQQAAEMAKAASQSMRNAAQAASKGQRSQAQQQGQQASGKMDQVQDEVQQERQAQQEAWREEVMHALDRALSETARLSRRQLEVSSAIRRGDASAATRAEQGAVEEGAGKLIEQMAALSGRNALVSPQIGVALTVARQQMARAREAIASASPNLREAADQAGEAVDALNTAAYGMLRARDDVQGSASGSGMAEAMERMAQMAQQQGALSDQTAALLPMAGQQSIQQQLRGLSEEQRAMAQELERMRARGQLPGTDQLAEEAKELARRLEAGRLDRETVARQERLFRRMLDAGRTLQGEEEDQNKERESKAPTDDTPRLPPALRARLDAGWRLPSWEELQRLSPEERRLVADYFRRLGATLPVKP